MQRVSSACSPARTTESMVKNLPDCARQHRLFSLMNRPRTNIHFLAVRGTTNRARAGAYFLLVACLILASAANGLAQQRITRRYPAGKNVRLELRNLSGTITVETWDRDEIKLTATLESPSAKLAPRQTDGSVCVDVEGDNRGRSD